MLDNTYLTFDDVVILPKFSDIKSRKDVDLSFNGSGYPYMTLPVLSANMDSITGAEMAKVMQICGGQGVLHRFCSIEDNVKMLVDSRVGGTGSHSFPLVSVGLGSKELERAEALFNSGAFSFIVDVAHGAQLSVVDQVRELKKIFKGNASIIVGNFATGQSIRDFLYCLDKSVEGFKVGIGGGCFAPSTRILMANGTYKNIVDIKLHDRVINKNGKSVDVIGTKFSGFKRVLSYKNNLFYEKTHVTPEHLHLVGDYSTTFNIDDHSITEVLKKPTREGQSKIKWKPIAEHGKITLLMCKNIEFDLPDSFEINVDDFSYSRRNMEGIVNYPKVVPSYDLGYVLGTFLGKGRARIGRYDRIIEDGPTRRNRVGSTAWYFGKEELYIAEKLIRSIKSSFGTNAVIQERNNMWTVFNRNNNISRFFLEFGKKASKHLPHKYICKNKEYLKGLLDGLIDSDGTYTKDGRIGFCNTSKELTEQFGVIFYIVNGYFPSICYREPSAGGLVNCNVDNCKPSYVSRSVTRPEFNDLGDLQINRISSVEEEWLFMPTYDIEVDCDTHSFIANNAIVHNSVCTTRVKTGCGMPQISAIMSAVFYLKNTGIPVIADGGIRSPGDAAKALGAGASLVMIGGMLSGTDESPGDLVDSNGQRFEFISDTHCAVKEGKAFKKYRGSASQESYQAQGKDDSWRTAEGVSTVVPYKGPANKVLQDIEGGLRSSFTYVGAKNLKEFHERVEFVKVSHAGYVEGTPHGKKE